MVEAVLVLLLEGMFQPVGVVEWFDGRVHGVGDWRGHCVGFLEKVEDVLCADSFERWLDKVVLKTNLLMMQGVVVETVAELWY